MDYIGEHRLPGQLGQFFIVLSLVASLVATFAYYKATTSKIFEDHSRWKKLARYAFITEAFSVFSVFGILFYIVYNHYFEYSYAWDHSSLSLEFKYILASIWEGQEGSFLLWSIWHCVLGLILIRTSKTWEAPVMTIVSFAQLCLATMIAGIYILNWKMGSNPFILLRDSGVLDNAVALHLDFDVNQPLRPDYLASIKDGDDLNVLLQNYWMVIHPPVLFLGFASTIVPFALAVAGLWTKQFGTWVKQALPWALFSAAVFGVGIMMGAAWAYESLTFGGYWAWDPVENASLVPWLIMIAGIHTLLIYKHTGHSLRATYLFLILSFCFVLYSTFLTRSGVLGETSVHAFTDLGMNFQLTAFLVVFVLPSLVLFATRYRDIPSIQKEENTSSREFWMFIGSLVFFLSAFVIIVKTSLPIFRIAPPEDPEFAYNSIQVYVAVIVALLTAFAQYLKYKETPGHLFWKKILVPAIASAGIATAVLALGDINYVKKGPVFQGSIWLAVAASIFTVIANASYIWIGIKGKLRLSGGSIAHLGFGLVLLGILISSSKKEVLSYNTSGIAINFGPDSKEETGENLTLVQGVKTDMGKYWVTYEGDRKHPKKEQWFYNIRMETKDSSENFILNPSAFINVKGQEGIQPEPDNKKYWDHDVFTYITALPDPDKNKDTASFVTSKLRKGDSLFYSGGFMIIEDVRPVDSVPADIKKILGPDGKITEAPIKVYSKTGSIFSLSPKLTSIRGDDIIVPDTLIPENLVIRLDKVNPDNSIELAVKESDAVMKYVTLKAYKFPHINLLWGGVIITAIGIIISMVHRIRQNRAGKNKLKSIT
jgi:cytochrome c-type biogenesis protein CcmF